jgi:hypothetical protein
LSASLALALAKYPSGEIPSAIDCSLAVCGAFSGRSPGHDRMGNAAAGQSSDGTQSRLIWPDVRSGSLSDIAFRLRHVCLSSRSRQRNIEFAKSILSNDCRARRTAIERSERAQIHCHPHRLVVIEPVSANRLHKNGNFCGLGWRLSADSRQGCHFWETGDLDKRAKSL